MIFKLSPLRKILYLAFLLLVSAFVLLPVLGMLRLATDASIHIAPTDFRLWPKEFTLEIIKQMWVHPAQTLSFTGLLSNSLYVSLSTALFSIVFGMPTAYAFARFRFKGRRFGLMALLVGTLLPSVALMTPLFILLTALKIRTYLSTLILVYAAFSMPFCIWNMRSAFQSIPRDLEEAANLDGASNFTTFWRIALPMALPSIAVSALVAFLAAYSEFAIGWLFVDNASNVTLAMALVRASSSNTVSWAETSALGLMMSIPVVLLFLLLQRFLVDQLLINFSSD
jgi:ABC-type glycerol-3-phosphate transport system permease component